MGVKSNSLYKVFMWIAASVGLIALGLACDDPSPEEAQAALCSDLIVFEQSMDNLTDLRAHSSVEELKTAMDDARDSYNEVVDSAAEVGNDRVDTVVDAYEDLQNAIDDLPDETTIQDGAASLQPEISAVVSARQDLRTGSGC
jgi:hypothetical protein